MWYINTRRCSLLSAASVPVTTPRARLTMVSFPLYLTLGRYYYGHLMDMEMGAKGDLVPCAAGNSRSEVRFQPGSSPISKPVFSTTSVYCLPCKEREYTSRRTTEDVQAVPSTEGTKTNEG